MDIGIVLVIFFGLALLISCFGIGAVIFRHYMMFDKTHINSFWWRQSLLMKYRHKLHK